MSSRRFYFDTSIWLDFIENRNEPNFPKGEWARKLVEKIIGDGSKIVLSDNNIFELEKIGYTRYEFSEIIASFKENIIYTRSKIRQIGRARDLAKKRNVPNRDALHALLARDNDAVLIAWDNHFKRIKDISRPFTPKEII